MSYKQRITEALENEDENITWLSRLSDKKLERKLSNIREQIGLAVKAQNTEALELLKVWEQQVIEARVIKHEQSPELNELSEIERELKEMEAFDELTERRMAILKPKDKKIEEPVEEELDTDSEIDIRKPADQLKLF